jgi:GntR family transcriptional regulator
MSRPEVTVLPDSIRVSNDSGSEPLYHELASKLERAISTGELPPGATLEGELALSQRLGISRPTVRRAIQELTTKGLIVRRRGIGTQVVQATLSRKVELSSLWEDLDRLGKKPSTRVLGRQIIPADEHVATELRLRPQEHVMHLQRLRMADGRPMALMENFLPVQFADISTQELEQHGLYQLLQQRGVVVQVAHQSITARRATTSEAKLLEIQRANPLLVANRTAYDASGSPIETGSHAYRPDLYAFEVTMVRR